MGSLQYRSLLQDLESCCCSERAQPEAGRRGLQNDTHVGASRDLSLALWLPILPPPPTA